MKLADLCIERPVFATMLMCAVLVLGSFSYFLLGVDLFPKIDIPFVTVKTEFRGAGPEEVETQITKTVEEAISTISGIDELRSTSAEGFSVVVVSFEMNRDVDACAADVRDRVGRILGKLPQGVEAPVVERIDPDATAVLIVSVTSLRPIKELTEYAKKRLKEPLESVLGVGQIDLVGGREREIHIKLNADRLRAYELTPQDVKLALVRQNVEMPGGLVETGKQDLVLRAMGRIEKVEDFSRVVVREVGGAMIRIGDLATVVDAEQEQRSMARSSKGNAVALSIKKQSGSNTVAVIENIKAKLTQLASVAPKDIGIEIQHDQSEFILGSFHAVMEHLIFGALLASLVVFLFLGDLRSTLIAATAIPISIVGSFSLIYYMGFTLNQMSLLALALAVGLVIDDAIVVLENIFRHLDEEGSPPLEAASNGTREIGPAVMATTFSLVVIFVPVAFMPGIIGRFIKAFALPMVFAILTSLLVSFTFTPMLCSRFLRLRKEDHNSGLTRGYRRLIEAPYLGLLASSLRHRSVVVLVALICILSTVPLLKMTGKDFIPADDKCEFLISIKAAEGTPLSDTSLLLCKMQDEIQSWPGVRSSVAMIGADVGSASNKGTMFVGLKKVYEREMSQAQYIGKARKYLQKTFPDLNVAVSVVPDISAGGIKQTDLEISFQGGDMALLKRYSGEVLEFLKGVPGVVDLDTSLDLGKPEVRVRTDRARAASLGVDPYELASTLRTLIGGNEEQVTKYKDTTRGEEYEVRVRLAEEFRNNPENIANLPIRTRDGFVKLSSLATVSRDLGPTQIQRYARQRQVVVTGNLQGLGVGDIQNVINARFTPDKFEPGYSYTYLGRGKEMGKMINAFLVAFALAAIFVYMILASQFESFVHPITILLSLPLCIPFGILSLVLTREPLHLFSILGLFMLFGIVKKNAILQVDYTNTLRAAGMERLKAMMEANKTRLRPILMTTLTLIAGMIPMALGSGPGSGSRRAMAIVIIGGQALCLLITLLLTPVAYSLFDDLANSRFTARLKRFFD
jgi:HAE1 family hydrophobic/amphiphilic exporter-1